MFEKSSEGRKPGMKKGNAKKLIALAIMMSMLTGMLGEAGVAYAAAGDNYLPEAVSEEISEPSTGEEDTVGVQQADDNETPVDELEWEVYQAADDPAEVTGADEAPTAGDDTIETFMTNTDGASLIEEYALPEAVDSEEDISAEGLVSEDTTALSGENGSMEDDPDTATSDADEQIRPLGSWLQVSYVYLYPGQKYNMAAKIKSEYTGTGKVKKYVVTELNDETPSKGITTVSSKGIVTAKGAGRCHVLALDKEGGLIASADIVVFEEKAGLSEFPVLTRKDQQFNVSEYISDPASLSMPQYKFKSSKPKVASIDASGNITAHKSGSAKISVTVIRDDKCFSSFTVSRTLSVKLPSISKKSITLTPGKTATITIKNAVGWVRWYIDHSDTLVPDQIQASGENFENFKIKGGPNGGVATIWAETEDGQVFECYVTVKQFGKRYYDDAGLYGKYDTANAKKILSGLNSYRKKNGLPALKTNTSLNVIAAKAAREKQVDRGYSLNYHYLGRIPTLIYWANRSKCKSFTVLRNEETATGVNYLTEQSLNASYTKAGCAVFYDIEAGKYSYAIVYY